MTSFKFLLCTLGFRLNARVLKSKIVTERIDCIMECATEPCCRSINYKTKTALDNETNCEMLHNLVDRNKKLLKRNASYDYARVVNPYKVKQK